MSICIEITENKNSITATIYKNDKFYTEIGCANLKDLFEILTKHEITNERT